jgi:hypothetical protein
MVAIAFSLRAQRDKVVKEVLQVDAHRRRVYQVLGPGWSEIRKLIHTRFMKVDTDVLERATPPWFQDHRATPEK